jgi:DNA adenine methylase
MLKPPIARMGGKSKLRKQILELIPEHTCYVEAFFGAGWVYFGKPESKVEVINDRDQELVNLFKMIKYHGDEVKRLLTYEVTSRDLFTEYMQQNIKNLTEIQRAVRFIYLITQSFASRGKHFGYSAVSGPSKQIFNLDSLGEIKARLNNTYIENLDYRKILDKYDRENTFFFCDPPYFDTHGYDEKFGEKEQLELLDKLKNIKGKFLLTLNDHHKVREWYKDFNIKEVQVNYSVSKSTAARGKYGELIIRNY